MAERSKEKESIHLTQAMVLLYGWSRLDAIYQGGKLLVAFRSQLIVSQGPLHLGGPADTQDGTGTTAQLHRCFESPVHSKHGWNSFESFAKELEGSTSASSVRD